METLLHEGRAMEFRNGNFLVQDSIDIAVKSELPTALYVLFTGEQYSNLMHKKANSLSGVLEYIAHKNSTLCARPEKYFHTQKGSFRLVNTLHC